MRLKKKIMARPDTEYQCPSDGCDKKHQAPKGETVVMVSCKDCGNRFELVVTHG